MDNLKGSQTEKNILTAFIGESQTRNRYTYFASKAKKEGYIQISKAFEETANHEKEHAKRLLKLLNRGIISIDGTYSTDPIGNTLENLKFAAIGENHEHSEMYPEFAKIAKQEHFFDIAEVFSSIAISEKYHETRFNGFINNISNNMVFKKDKSVIWRCINCGFNHNGMKTLDVCPSCNHPKSYFELLCTNW